MKPVQEMTIEEMLRECKELTTGILDLTNYFKPDFDDEVDGLTSLKERQAMLFVEAKRRDLLLKQTAETDEGLSRIDIWRMNP